MNADRPWNVRPLSRFLGTGLALSLGILLASGELLPVEAARKKSGSASTGSSRKKKTESAPTAASSPEQYYETAWQRFEIGTPKERQGIITELKDRSKQDPNDGTCHYYLGMMLSRTGSSKAAEDHLRAAAAAFPQSPDVQYQLAEQLLQRNQPDEAVTLYEKILTLQPTHGGALTRLGLKALDEAQYQKALELFTKAREASPDNRETLRGLAFALHHNEKHAEAVSQFKTVLDLDEKDPEAWMLLGKSYEQLGKVKEASEALEKAKQLGRTDETIKGLVGYDLARNLYATGKTAEAVKEYQKTIKTSPEPATGWFELGKLYDEQHDSDAAIDAYRKAFEADDQRGEAILRIAELLHLDGRLDEALGALELISRKKAWSERAKAMIDEISEEKKEETQTSLMETAQTGSEDAREQAYQELLAIDKKDQAALEGLRQLAVDRGDLDQAEYYIKQLKKAGHLTKQQADAEIAALKEKMDAGEDLSVWENRLEEYKRDSDWDKAIEMNTKIRDYAKNQLENWKRFSPSNAEEKATKAKMIKLTQVRLRLIRETMNDLKNAKKRSK
ncbi:MAG TPA: tetratricopeptide repeat protein [Candidatus Ozemobacteraceae bacterium]|nr:tetratricopeptide repeat protein [Candidatus Ozemobacteraceae bacterium]